MRTTLLDIGQMYMTVTFPSLMNLDFDESGRSILNEASCAVIVNERAPDLHYPTVLQVRINLVAVLSFQCEVSASRPTATPIQCPVRAKAMQLAPLPKGIRDNLVEIERSLEKKIHGDTLYILANIVYMDKVIWQRTFGNINGGQSRKRSSELSKTMVFPVASVTKVLTALMLYKLYHEKKVQILDDPFKKYLPEFSIKDPFNSHDITLREMVSHLSGLPREAPCFPQVKQGVCQVNNSVMIQRIKNLSLVVEPGSKLEIKLFNSTEENDFLSPVITEEFFSPAYILDGQQFIGSPWEMRLMDGYVARMKNGYVYGYSSNIFLFPDLKLAFNIFNAGVIKGCSSLAHRLLKAFHHELIARDHEQERTFSAQEAAPYVGEFQTDDVPTIRRVVIRHHDGKLQFYVDKFQFHLSHVSGLTFELIDRRKINCLPMVVMGVNHEKVHFHPPMTDYISPGFTVFGFNLQGKAYFYRKKTEELLP
ncbi:Beta-lactamase-like protein 2 [Acropora cervicornis]|uniref:Beta-lactamase-like protein 2 n=1 Tax=Acropora cervicornis TaxID=6130 RepID=A0AAD9V847_ACRCE|nr:Beta-lactamase-like protein 2 [Acropora cervicornis]